MPPSIRSAGRLAAILSALLVSLLSVSSHAIWQPAGAAPLHLQVPDGFTIERIAGPDLLSYPMFGVFDDEGRLFLFESTEPNTMTTEQMLAAPSYHIRVLEDVDGDGHFDRSRIYADKLPFPKGGAFLGGSLFVSAAPDLLRFEDTDGDLVADERETVLSGWTLNVNGAALGGPFLGPDGWLYLTDARRGFRITRKEGDTLEGRGARIWRVRPDGAGLEWLSGGGFDNAVELVFMPSGDVLGTMTYIVDPKDGVRDALVHWVEGGVYPKPHEVIAADRLPLTGDYLPAMTMLARVAPSGLMRYRGDALGSDMHGNLFSAQFNTGRVMRHVLTAQGATYRTEDLPFVTATSPDAHPTDVLQDADGSLIVIETGGWFIKGCPLSRVAKPEVAGGVYRIRKKGAPVVADPGGRQIEWAALAPAALTTLMTEERIAVRDRAAEELTKAGLSGVLALDALRRTTPDVEARAAAVFAMHRIGTIEARAGVRAALDDADAAVRVAALRSVGLARDRDAAAAVGQLLASPDPQVQRQAAVAAERIGLTSAADALLGVLRTPADRFVEHAAIHALIALKARVPVRKALASPATSVRRAALIALDQMEQGGLTPADVRPFLLSRDDGLWRTGMWVASHHQGWSASVIAGVRARLHRPSLGAADAAALRDVMVGVCRDDAIQRFVGAELAGAATGGERLEVLAGVVENCAVDKLPPVWVAAVRGLLQAPTAAVRARAVKVTAARRIEALAADLERLAGGTTRSVEERLDAAGALVLVRPAIAPPMFDWLTSLLDRDRPAHARQQAAGVLAQAALSDAQLVALAKERLGDVDAFLLPRLINAYDRTTSVEVGVALLAALETSIDRLDVVSERDLTARLTRFPEPVPARAQKLLVAVRQRQNARLARLETIDNGLGRGDIDAGRRLFFGKATCSTCHAVGREGADFGPDLSNIGEIRSRHDILEAVLYPSASFAREYETWRVRTRGGENTGIVKQELPDAVVMATAPGATIRIPRRNIAAVEPVEFSVMPPGLEQLLSSSELSDLMAYLEALPDPFDRKKRP